MYWIPQCLRMLKLKCNICVFFLSYFVPNLTLKNILVLPNVTYTEED